LFTFNPNTGVLEFGDSISNTLAPADNQPIGVYFEPERLFPSETEDEHIAKLDFPTSNNKDDFIIKRHDVVKSQTEILPRKSTVIKLDQSNIVDFTDITRALVAQGMDSTPKTFLNGRDELLNAGDWSIDTLRGVVYTFTPTSTTQNTSATYTYQPITTLTVDDWEWATTTLLRDSVSIKEAAWLTNNIDDFVLPTTANIRVLDLPNLSVTKNSLNLTVTVSGVALPIEDPLHPFLKEVDFINGAEELGGEFLKTTESIPTDLVPVANIATFNLKENISTLTAEHPISFSNTTLFATAVVGAPTMAGEYEVDRSAASPTYGRVRFWTTATATSPGTTTYFFSSSGFASNGLYSVDYHAGRIFTQRSVNPSSDGTYGLTADFQYTDYRAEYKIARLLSRDSYKVDITNATVTILDKEVLKRVSLPHIFLDNRTPLYLINYDYVAETRENITELQPKFSPVLKDFALRIITKGKAL
jgi:hypothetical protein